MAGVMGRSFASTARAAGRFCGNKAATACNGGTSSAAAAGRAMPRPSAAPSPSSFNTTSPKTFMEARRRPGSVFGRLPGEVAMAQSLLPLHNATASARMVSLLRSSAGTLQGTLHMDIS